MLRIATKAHNLEASQWLRERALIKEKIVWVGYGLSFALAQAFAEIFQQMGVISWAMTPAELERVDLDILVGYVSRSASQLNQNVDFLITQEGSDISWTDAVCLSVSDIDNGKDVWLALDYTKETLLSFSKVFRLGNCKVSYVDTELQHNKINVVVFETYAKPVQLLFQACNDKMNQRSLIAMNRREIGHGFHYRLWAESDRYILYLCQISNWDDVRKLLETWLERVGVPGNYVFLNDELSESGKVIEAFCIGIELVKKFARLEQIVLCEKPLPAVLDGLR